MSATTSIFTFMLLFSAGDTHSANRPHFVWEVDLLPGTFRVHCETQPRADAGKQELHSLTVAFHTPDNVQFTIVTGNQRVRSNGLKDLLHPAGDSVRVDEVRMATGTKDGFRVISRNAAGLTFTLAEKTRVFFAADSVCMPEPERFEPKGFSLLKEWSAWRTSYEPLQRGLPMAVTWAADREVYRLGIECFQGDFDYRDWLVTVDYLE